jgi:hypothetical protein
MKNLFTISLILLFTSSLFADLRNMPGGNKKEFEHKSGNVFYAETNDRTIEFVPYEDAPGFRMDKIVGKKKWFSRPARCRRYKQAGNDGDISSNIQDCEDAPGCHSIVIDR